jgi:Flp pilus assembly pilin Flp
MIKNMVNKVKEFHNDDRGDVVQTAILTAVFAVLAIGGYVFLAPKVKELFNKAGSELDKGSSYSY